MNFQGNYFYGMVNPAHNYQSQGAFNLTGQNGKIAFGSPAFLGPESGYSVCYLTSPQNYFPHFVRAGVEQGGNEHLWVGIAPNRNIIVEDQIPQGPVQVQRENHTVNSQKRCNLQTSLGTDQRANPVKRRIQKTKQNPRRNTVTNIGNQLLTFSSNKSKCLRALPALKEGYSAKEVDRFFEYIGNVRSSIGYYLNYPKMKKLWFPKSGGSSQKNSQKMFRIVSHFYLSNFSRLIVLNSTKMQQKSRSYHIKAIRRLLRDLKNGPK